MTRHFDVDEANARVPALERIFGRVMQMRVQLKSLMKRLEQAGHPPSIENPDKPINSSSAAVQRDHAVFRALVESMQEAVSEVEPLGAQVKDMETGLCDFPARRDGREILLCWKYGEKAIEYWHDLDSGFAGRRKLTDDDKKKLLPSGPRAR